MRRRPGRSLALWLCLTVTVALGGMLPLAGASADQTARAATLARSGSLTVEREVSDPDAFEAFRRAVGDRVRAVMGNRLRPGVAYGRLGPLALISVNGRPWPGRSHLEAMSLSEPPAADAARDRGATHQPPLLGMTRADARRLGLTPGDDLCLRLVTSDGTWCARLVGLRDVYGESSAEVDPGTTKLAMPLPELLRLARQAPTGALEGGVTYRLDPARATEVPAGRLAQRIERLVAMLKAAGYRVPSSPATTLARLDVEQRATAAWLRTLATLVALEGLVASLGVANRLLEGWRGEAAILRARGWTWRQVWQVELTVLGWIFASAAATALSLGSALSRATAGAPPPLPNAHLTFLIAPSEVLVSLAGALAATSFLDALRVPARPLPPEPRSGPSGRARLATALLGLPGTTALALSLARGSVIPVDLWSSLALTAGALLVGIAIAHPPRPLRRRGHDPAAVLARGQGRSRPTQHLAATLLLALAAATVVLAAPAATAPFGPSSPGAGALGAEAAAACLGAATLAWVGLAVHFQGISRRRRHEYKGLAAHGLSQDQIRWSLALERRWTWWSGLGGGTLLGLALQAWHLPTATTLSWPATGLTSVALCGLAAGSVGSASLADRSSGEIDPLTAGAIEHET